MQARGGVKTRVAGLGPETGNRSLGNVRKRKGTSVRNRRVCQMGQQTRGATERNLKRGNCNSRKGRGSENRWVMTA